jgi:hypothetical protein
LDRDAIAALENATEFIGTAKRNIWIYFYCSSIFGCDLIDLLPKGTPVAQRSYVFERTNTGTN